MYNSTVKDFSATNSSTTDSPIKAVHGSDEEETSQNVLHLVQLVCLCTISIVGSIGNLIICTATLRGRTKSSEYFILNLAIADLLVCIIGIPLDIYLQYYGDTWPYGGFLCRIIYPSQTLLVLISIMTLTGMSLERYRAIMTPMRQRLRKAMLLAIIGFLWSLSIAVVVPYAMVLGLSENNTCQEFWSQKDHGNYYTLTLFIIDYCIPLTIISFCYSRAGFELQTKFKALNARRQSCSSNNRGMMKRLEQNKRVVKIFSLAVVMFVVCMLPGDAYWMWSAFGDGSDFVYASHFQIFTNILLYANSAINPFIFGACQVICCRRTQRLLRRNFSTTSEVTWAMSSKSSSVRLESNRSTKV